MEEPVLPGEESYDDPVHAAPRKVIDHNTFRQPISSIGMRQCVILGEDTPVADAIRKMRQARIGSVLITGADGKLTGIFTERDALYKIALGDVDHGKTALREVMHRDPESLTLDDEVGYALRIMSHGGYRRVPLVDPNGVPVGLISVRDIVDHIADLFPDEILTRPSDPRSVIAKTPEGA